MEFMLVVCQKPFSENEMCSVGGAEEGNAINS